MNINLLKAAYLWGRDNGQGKSDKNFNDFLQTPVAKMHIDLEYYRTVANTQTNPEILTNELLDLIAEIEKELCA